MTTWHMSGAGNTFVVIDDRRHELPLEDIMAMTPALCDRTALGLPRAEGVLVLRDTGVGRFRADFLNPDGSYGAMCGNGSRAITRFALDHGMQLDASGDIAMTLSGERYTARACEDGSIEVDFDAPRAERAYPQGTLDGIDAAAYYVDVNSDHVVVDADASTFDPAPLRHHPAFERGVNVNMVRIDDGRVLLATFERGVEGITGACGTGALSTALALWRSGRVGDHVQIEPPSGRILTVQIHHHGDTVTGLTLRGDAVIDAPTAAFDIMQRRYL